MSIVTLNDRAVRSVTTFGSVSGGSMVFIKKLTASSSSTLSFVDGSSDVTLDSTFKEYVFTFKNIHPNPTGNAHVLFNFSADTGSNYNVTKTTSAFRAYHDEGNSGTNLAYDTAADLAQSTDFQQLTAEVTFPASPNNDEHYSGFYQVEDLDIFKKSIIHYMDNGFQDQQYYHINEDQVERNDYEEWPIQLEFYDTFNIFNLR